MGVLERYEYSCLSKLESDAAIYFTIPSSVILNKYLGERRISTFSFFSVIRGIDKRFYFSINSIVEWTKRKPDRHKNSINQKFIETVCSLEEDGYIELYEKPQNTCCTMGKLNIDKINEECSLNRYCVLYLDELNKIFNYRNSNLKGTSINSDTILLVFAYLRMKMFRRRNKLLPEEINFNNKGSHDYDITIRRRNNPEVFSGYFCDIEEELGIPSRSISKIVDILKELELIYYEKLPRTKHNDKWTTNHTLFCNYYKRMENYLLADGENYYMNEINNKKKQLKI